MAALMVWLARLWDLFWDRDHAAVEQVGLNVATRRGHHWMCGEDLCDPDCPVRRRAERQAWQHRGQ